MRNLACIAVFLDRFRHFFFGSGSHQASASLVLPTLAYVMDAAGSASQSASQSANKARFRVTYVAALEPARHSEALAFSSIPCLATDSAAASGTIIIPRLFDGCHSSRKGEIHVQGPEVISSSGKTVKHEPAKPSMHKSSDRTKGGFRIRNGAKLSGTSFHFLKINFRPEAAGAVAADGDPTSSSRPQMKQKPPILFHFSHLNGKRRTQTRQTARRSRKRHTVHLAIRALSFSSSRYHDSFRQSQSHTNPTGAGLPSPAPSSPLPPQPSSTTLQTSVPTLPATSISQSLISRCVTDCWQI